MLRNCTDPPWECRYNVRSAAPEPGLTHLFLSKNQSCGVPSSQACDTAANKKSHSSHNLQSGGRCSVRRFLCWALYVPLGIAHFGGGCTPYYMAGSLKLHQYINKLHIFHYRMITLCLYKSRITFNPLRSVPHIVNGLLISCGEVSSGAVQCAVPCSPSRIFGNNTIAALRIRLVLLILLHSIDQTVPSAHSA